MQMSEDTGDLGLVHRVHHQDAVGIDGACALPLADAERVECRERVGAELDAGADLAELSRLLEDLDAESLLGKCERGGKAADAAARDEDGLVHGLSLTWGELVAWGGIEPPTHGFSVHCSTN